MLESLLSLEGSGRTLHKLQVHRRTNTVTHSVTLNLRRMSRDWTKKTPGGVSWSQTCTFPLPLPKTVHTVNYLKDQGSTDIPPEVKQ